MMMYLMPLDFKYSNMEPFLNIKPNDGITVIMLLRISNYNILHKTFLRISFSVFW